MRRRHLGLTLGAALLFASAGYGCSLSGGAKETPTPGTGSCPDDATFFESHVWNPILSIQCVGCHNASGPANFTRMVFHDASMPDYLSQNLAIAKKMAGIASSGTSILLLKPSGQYPTGHVGGTLFTTDSPSYAAMELFVSRANGVSGACAQSLDCSGQALTPGKRALRRLSLPEYDNTVQDLLGQPSTYGATFPPDNAINGFDNNAASLVVAPLLADDLRTAAEGLAATAAMNLTPLLPCDPVKAGADACAVSFIQSFGARAFRRPLTQTEVVNYKTLYNLAANNATCDDPFTDGAELVITGMLQSPSFLYRTELGAAGAGGIFTLTPYEVASELSYMIWGSMPDDTLFAAAAAGQLSTPAQIGAQATRLMASPKSRTTLDHFAAQWLEVLSVVQVPKDATVYPNLTDPLRADMLSETMAVVEHAVYDQGGTFTDLFTSKTSYMSSELAAFYGFQTTGQPDPTSGLYQVALPAQGYAGVLTEGSVLTVEAKANASSPILRGKLIREQFLCQALPPPPAGVNANPPTPSPNLSTRALYAQHSEYQPCQSCHRLMDPIGFGFEHFDGVGVWRATENGQPIDPGAQIVSSQETDGTYADAAALGQALAKSPEVQECFALEWFRFAYGIDQTAVLQCTVQKLAKDFAGGGLAIGSLVLDLAQQPHFTTRLTDGVQGDGSPAPDMGGTPPASMPPAPNPLQLAFSSMAGAPGTYWETITVTNVSSAPVTWQFSVTLGGSLVAGSVSGAIATVSGSTVTFSGEPYNATLAPGAMVSVNFNANGSPPPPPPTCGP